MSTRITELLNLAADTLDDQVSPFTYEWLDRNHVTFDECMALSDQLATAARLLAFLHENPDVFRGAVTGATTAAAYQALNKALDRFIAEKQGTETAGAPR